MSLNSSAVPNTTFAEFYRPEPDYHFDPRHTVQDCCLSSSNAAEVNLHKSKARHTTLTWSNVGCELKKAIWDSDERRKQECLDMLKQPSVLSSLGRRRVSDIAANFDISFLKEYLAVQTILAKLVRYATEGRTTCQFADRTDFKFVEYLDSKAPVVPSEVRTIHRTTLLKIMKWAHANDNTPIAVLMEEFLLADEAEKYFTHHMLMHLANRFDFPTLRMKCLSSLRTVDDIKYFEGSANYRLHLSPSDRKLVERRREMFLTYRDATGKVDDEVYQIQPESVPDRF